MQVTCDGGVSEGITGEVARGGQDSRVLTLMKAWCRKASEECGERGGSGGAVQEPAVEAGAACGR